MRQPHGDSNAEKQPFDAAEQRLRNRAEHRFADQAGQRCQRKVSATGVVRNDVQGPPYQRMAGQREAESAETGQNAGKQGRAAAAGTSRGGEPLRRAAARYGIAKSGRRAEDQPLDGPADWQLQAEQGLESPA